MYLKTLKIWNFRKYGRGDGEFASSLPGLVVEFHEGLNVLIGENDSGKTAVIDAIRYVLHTPSREYIPIDEKDFHYEGAGRAEELKIECTFDGLTEQDQGLFLEWLTMEDHRFKLRVWLYAKRKDNAVISEFYAGTGDGAQMDSGAKALLRSVYLKPLRDALTDMTHGYKSRFAQILGAHEVFKTKPGEDGQTEKHQLVAKYEKLKQEIEDYFKGEQEGNAISNGINELLKKHFLFSDEREAQIKLAGGELTEILHQLDLILEGNKSGLGTLNLLCMAAEMLMLEQQKKGLKLVLIEELEAHLHPQYQMNVIDYIKSVVKIEKTQFILSTHSITIGSKLPLESLIVFRGDKVYPMGHDYTKLAKSDYSFMERFLDATKANMFFARGVIIVEGDAEALLLPAIAEAIGKPLNQNGVSIVNVGSTAYKRYAKIFQRKDGSVFDMPVSIVTDMDIPVMAYFKEDVKREKYAWAGGPTITRIKAKHADFDGRKIPEYFRFKSTLQDVLSGENISQDEIDSLIDSLGDKQSVSQEMLNSLRAHKREALEREYSQGKTKIFLPQEWTLEYEIAKSGLAKDLYIARVLAKAEDNNAISDFSKALNKAKTKAEKLWKDSDATTEDFAYGIFKPLNNQTVSKAATAQYLAEKINPRSDKYNNTEEAQTEIVNHLTNDPRLSYLIEAINHVTKQREE